MKVKVKKDYACADLVLTSTVRVVGKYRKQSEIKQSISWRFCNKPDSLKHV